MSNSAQQLHLFGQSKFIDAPFAVGYCFWTSVTHSCTVYFPFNFTSLPPIPSPFLQSISVPRQSPPSKLQRALLLLESQYLSSIHFGFGHSGGHELVLQF